MHFISQLQSSLPIIYNNSWNGHVFQAYLIAFAVQWNNRMASLQVAGGQARQTSCVDVRQIQRMNQQAEVLFGKDHVLEPNFAAPMPVPDTYEHPDEEELLGVEYAMCQSTSFTARDFYVQRGTALNHTLRNK